jgi:chromosome segregation ATPase
MARDKLITIRIEGDKRDAFNQLAKAQNTDTASLLYDFINQCLSGKIDISLVTGKKQWIDKIDNQLDTNRLDKLEATTQRIDRIDIAIQRLDNRIDGIETITQRLAKRLDDWIEAIDDRLTDCDQGLSEKIITLEHRINALSFQLDRQDRQEIDNRIDDMEPLLKLQREASIASHSPSPPDRPAIETAIEPAIGDEPAIEDVIEAAIEPAIEDAIKVKPRRGYSNSELSEKINISKSTIEKWKARIQRGEKFEPKVYPNFFDHWILDTDNLWYEKD